MKIIDFLNEQECEELKKSHRQEKNRRKADRIKAVLSVNKGWSYSEIAEALLLDEDTISHHIGSKEITSHTENRTEFQQIV
ncbi:MAG: hypothetical protein FWC41_03905 [Firmicutes bacterium]|nr:hypothetical protein [Bacillota bacterium]